MSTINIKINEIALHYFEGNNSKFALAMGTNEANIRNYRTSIVPKIEFVIRLCEKLEINYEWLLTGKSPLLKNKTVPSDNPNKERRVGIPLILEEAVKEFILGTHSPAPLEGERFIVPSFKEVDFLLAVRGDSMYPKYNSGAIVACKKLGAASFFQWNKVYVLDTEQGVLIKRICQGSDRNHILIVSENLSYPPFELPLEAISALALVLGAILLE